MQVARIHRDHPQFEAAQGGQIAWLIPAALALLALGIMLRGSIARTDPIRAALIVWGAWLLVTGLMFSFMVGISHAYYTSALAHAVAACSAAARYWHGGIGTCCVCAWSVPRHCC